jgi:hypothetical protein
MMVFILLTAASLAIITLITLHFYNKQQKKRLKKSYTNALFGNDIDKAIAAGRAYYQKRNGALTSGAEKAIQRDLIKNGLLNPDAAASE